MAWFFSRLGDESSLDASGSPSSGSAAQASAAAPAPSITADIAADVQNGSLTYAADLSILEAAAVGGMTASKFSALEFLRRGTQYDRRHQLGLRAADHRRRDLRQFGERDMERRRLHSDGLGNLTRVDPDPAEELIGEWFLGTNMPRLNLTAVGQENLNPTYQAHRAPLTPERRSNDQINQGYLGDCYFLSSLGEIALKDPTTIENMIGRQRKRNLQRPVLCQRQAGLRHGRRRIAGEGRGSNGPTPPGSNSPTGRPHWVALVEKAYAQLNEQTKAPHGELNSASDSYEDIPGGRGRG